MRRRGSLLFSRQGREHLESGGGIAAAPVGGPQYQTGMRMPRDGFEDLVRLFHSESGIPLQKSRSVPKRNVKRSDGL